jgi:hypothetical protein
VLHHADALIFLHPSQVFIVCDDRLGTRVDRAFDDTVIVRIAGDDFEFDLRHAPHRAFADVFFLQGKAPWRVIELRLQYFHHFVHDRVGNEQTHFTRKRHFEELLWFSAPD